MTETDSVLGDDRLRLLDVLLEEEARESGARSAVIAGPPRHWLRAIAALLGIAVVVATSWLAVRPPVSAPAEAPQDPEPARRVVPFDPALLSRVVGVRVGGSKSHIEQSGTKVVNPLQPPVEFRQPEVLQRWRSAIAACTPDKDGKASRMFWLELDLGDGTVMTGTADIRGMLRFGDHGRGANEEVRDLLLMVTQQVARQRRRVEQIALTLEELRALPADLRRVASPLLTAAEARVELARFCQLEVLEFVPHVRGAALDDRERRSVVANDVVAGLAAIPTLREVTLHVDLLHAEGLRALAALPKLQTLNVYGEARSMPAQQLGELTRRLATLRLLGGEPTAEQLREIAKSPTLRELWLPCGPELAPAAICLATLPALHTLSLQGNGMSSADDVLAAILRTRVRELRLARLRVDGKSLARLVDLTGLQTLELVDLRLEPDQLGGLAPLPQVQHFATDVAAPRFQALFAAFPNATVHTGRKDDTWVSPFAVQR